IEEGALAPLHHRFRIKIIAAGELLDRSLRSLYRSSDGVRGLGAAVKNLSHRASRNVASAWLIPRHSGTAHLVDRNSGVAQPLLLHQGEQNGGIGGMQPDAAAGRRSAELRDVRRAVDGEIAVVEDRIWHRCIVVEGRAVVARERLRAEGPA